MARVRQPGAGEFGDVLVRLAGGRPGMLVVAGADPGPAAWFAEVWPERVLTVPPASARLSVAEGIRLGGGDAIVVWDADATWLPLAPTAGVVVVSETPAHLGMGHRAGVDVRQPGWPEDLPAVLADALGQERSTLLHLPTFDPDLPPHPGPHADPLDGPRVLHRGGDGMLVGAGATAAIAGAVAGDLAARGCQLTALEMVVITSGSGLDAGLLHDHLLVGGLDVPRAAALAEVPVGGDLSTLSDAVLAQLRGA